MKAKKLNPGDTVAIIAPASPASQAQIQSVEDNMKCLGLNYEMLPSCFKTHGHLAGTDDIRLKDIHDAFMHYDGIICLKGGYGTPRLLDLIDYDLIKNNPKVFLGYSDITGLHMAIYNKTGLITFHGPMAMSNLKDDYTVGALKNALMSSEPLGHFDNPKGENLETLVPGITEGELVGGNLSLLVSTLGSPYEINTKGKIFFIEEVNETNYCVDRMLTSLRLAGKFDDCSGIILGTFSGCEPEVIANKKTDLDLICIFNEIIVPAQKPTVMNFRAGHNSPQPTLPLGTKVKLNANIQSIEFLEAGVL